MIEKWNEMSFEKVNLIKEIKLSSWLKASFYDTFYWVSDLTVLSSVLGFSFYICTVVKYCLIKR
jgi:hypothetical protein